MPEASRSRYDRIDVLRGLAIAWMTAYHFAFDLDWFGWWRQDFHADPVWTWQRTAIVSAFLFCAGLGQAAASLQGQGWPRFWRRWAQVAGCAVVVSIGSYLAFPDSFIYFGVLHGIAVMLVIARLTAHWGAWLWLAGAVVIALKFGAQAAHGAGLLPEALNTPAWNWLGLIGRKPVTQDYVPLVPWLGVVWWGMAAGRWTIRRRPAWVAGAVPPGTAWLRWMGRWSLSWYMLHQPVLIGLIAAASRALR
ncbi:DUF1624 domain-containing protein [Ramlibacter sp. AW1]|uniref:DUF1624 domain-containing protein n=1 Tax=Ramlibacter aurantiacus TaxID=2801330 RepID=A0A936ZMD2_9BURK|nr:heparan-alpha-glucosaminide N-acetyltransferase [Ramlibacter aurantiacus]MBL0418826.1 DUF1624 domain-containing protein [Ramlibacter aurantiacus]